MQISDSPRSWLLRIVFAAALLAPRPSLASQEFPAAIQEAAGMPCAPSCVLCHAEDPGTASSFTKKALGRTLVTYGGNFVAPHDTTALKSNYSAYKVTAEGALVQAALEKGIDPETNVDLCSGSNNVTYGCGAHVATKTPPREASALLWIVGAMTLGALVRRARARA